MTWTTLIIRIHPAACQIEGCDPSTGCLESDGVCPLGYTDILRGKPDTVDGACVSLYPATTWSVGHTMCKAVGAQMVRIANKTISDNLAKFLRKRDTNIPPAPVWIGYERQLRYSTWPLTFYWTDESKVEPGYMKWGIE